MINGACVRLTKGDYSTKKEYHSNPLDIAQIFESAGIQQLHLVDLDGAKAGKVINWNAVENITKYTNLAIDFGGGVRTSEEVKRLFDLGVKQITGGSIAIKNKALFTEWVREWGGDKIILGVDVKDEKVAVSGWEETTSTHIYDFLDDYVALGVKYIVCTDISKDGMLQGTSNELYKNIQSQYPDLKIVASGGVANMNDIRILDEMGIYAVIFGKAYYEGHISLEEIKSCFI
jgi:phosphoribosylformimino-5-aminoimidazole carboxamide ribotide isomerase